MANITASQTLIDGSRNVAILLTGLLDTGNVGLTTAIDTPNLAGAPKDLTIDEIYWSISGPMQVALYWDATVDDFCYIMSGADHQCFDDAFGGLKNPRSTGFTGRVLFQTFGWAATIQSYSILIHATKRGA